ncbi:MAG: hypothetical protein HUU41_19870 [Bryobacteraceae bacterium]|nr:hypothetical protein [Bryobacteraceae bacterium]
MNRGCPLLGTSFAGAEAAQWSRDSAISAANKSLFIAGFPVGGVRWRRRPSLNAVLLRVVIVQLIRIRMVIINLMELRQFIISC